MTSTWPREPTAVIALGVASVAGVAVYTVGAAGPISASRPAQLEPRSDSTVHTFTARFEIRPIAQKPRLVRVAMPTRVSTARYEMSPTFSEGAGVVGESSSALKPASLDAEDTASLHLRVETQSPFA